MNWVAVLRGGAPPWAALIGEGAGTADFIVGPPLPDGDAVPATIVRVSGIEGWLSVSERDPGSRLPERCPELHVNEDSSFCMARRGYRCGDAAGADMFWQDIGEYLVNQHFAARRGRWPVGRWLSHGPAAADRQVEAEKLAAELGAADAYADCLESDEGWIAELVQSGGPKVPRLLPCPLGCRNPDGVIATLGDCGHRSPLQKIVAAERQRRAAQGAYFAALRQRNRKCCGRVRGCPLDREMAA